MEFKDIQEVHVNDLILNNKSDADAPMSPLILKILDADN